MLLSSSAEIVPSLSVSFRSSIRVDDRFWIGATATAGAAAQIRRRAGPPPELSAASAALTSSTARSTSSTGPSPFRDVHDHQGGPGLLPVASSGPTFRDFSHVTVVITDNLWQDPSVP